ncbi:hypothetical protein MMC07_009325 [Pseudocyphellaria aurata]|nr:hypothetical protein [Pseudocyphellaria aurata]
MAGRAKDKKAEPSTRSKKPAVPSPDDLPLNGGQHVVDLRGSQSRRPSYGKDSQHTRQADRFPVASGSREREVGIQLTTSTTQGSSDLLWITTDRPTDFKDAKVQKLISKHVMRDFQLKDQSGKDSGRSRRKKSSQSSQSDDDFGLRSQQSKMPIVERSSQSANRTPVLGSSSAPEARQASSLFDEMYFPLSVDLDSYEFRQRLGYLIARYLSIWYREQAFRLCEVSDYEAWEQWMPSILQNETLLYAQAFAAVNHMNFMNPKAYKAECYVLKGHAIHKINAKMNDPDEAASDANIGAVLCMASAAHLENYGANNYTAHMFGLKNLVALRGGMQNLRENRLLHESLSVCDILGRIIFRTELALLSQKDLRGKDHSELEDDSARDILDSPLSCRESDSEEPKYGDLPKETVAILNAMLELTGIFGQSGPRANLSESQGGTRWASIYRRLELSALPQDQVYEACRFAAMIYLRALYHNVPFGSPANSELVHNLRTSLENTVADRWHGVPGVCVWALLIGTAADRTNTTDVFLAGHLSTICLSLVQMGHDVAELLKHFLWLEKAVEEKASRFSAQDS